MKMVDSDGNMHRFLCGILLQCTQGLHVIRLMLAKIVLEYSLVTTNLKISRPMQV